MVSVLSWAANLALFVLGCFLAADTANAILAATLLSPPDEAGEAAAPPTLAARSWEEREMILSRNLFKSSTLESAVSVEPVEDIEPTQLPLTLLGTAAAENPRLAWAAIEDRDKRETVVVGIGDRVAGKAAVQRIERRRVVLLENGSPRELTLDTDDEESAKPRTTARARPSPSRSRASRRGAARARPGDELPGVARHQPRDALRDPANIFSQARILPKWEDGEMLGVELAAIKNGSLLQDAGFQNGDIIVEMNGIAVDSPEQSAKILKEFTTARGISATVNRKGRDVTVQFDVNE
jgi:type II secretion system protein C